MTKSGVLCLTAAAYAKDCSVHQRAEFTLDTRIQRSRRGFASLYTSIACLCYETSLSRVLGESSSCALRASIGWVRASLDTSLRAVVGQKILLWHFT